MSHQGDLHDKKKKEDSIFREFETGCWGKDDVEDFPEVLLSLWSETKWSESRSVVSDSLQPHGLYSPWNSPGQNTGVGSLSLLQGIFPNQVLNPGFLNCRQILDQLSHKGSPWQVLIWEILLLFMGSCLFMPPLHIFADGPVLLCDLGYQWWVYISHAGIFCTCGNVCLHIEQDLSGLFWCLAWETHLSIMAFLGSIHPSKKLSHRVSQGFPDGSAVKNLLGIQETQETQVWFLGQEDPQEEEVVTHSSILPWEIPQTEEPAWQVTVHSVAKS